MERAVVKTETEELVNAEEEVVVVTVSFNPAILVLRRVAVLAND